MKAVIFDDVLATLDHHYRVAGLELAFFEHGDQAEAVVAQRAEVVAAVKAQGYRYVTLDLEGLRSGNLNDGHVSSATEPGGAP